MFHSKLDDEVLVREHLDLIGGPLGAQNANHSVFNSICWMHKRAAWVDLGPQGSAAVQPHLRMTSVFCKENECFVFFRGSLETLGGLI